jgi:hypothetical protein
MFKYSLDAAMLNEARPEAEKVRPCRVNIDIGPSGNPINVYFSSLGNAVAEHTRCRVIWLCGSEYYNQTDRLAVFGFQADVEYFNVLYTTLFLHMSGIFFPKPDPAKSLDENVMQLRRMGMNWLQMAEVYGYHKVVAPEFYFGMEPGKEYWYNKVTGDLKTNFQIGGYFKRVCHRAYRNAGIPLLAIPSVDSRRAERAGYRASVASGYVGRVTERLRAARGDRSAEPGTELVLVSAARAIEDMIADEFPRMEIIKNENDDFNPEAYLKGMTLGNEADLNTGSRMSGSTKGALGNG